jgi:ABC-2 type transport system permease protein
MWYILAKKEIKAALRERVFYLLTITLWALLLVAALGGYKNYVKAEQDRTKAAQLFRHEWEEQQANPHSAAHFGTYLFKPLTFIGLYDKGLTNYTGTTYRVEAHQQHEINYALAQDSTGEMRFGELTVASIFQLLVPLLIIFLGFSSVAREREINTLRLLLAQGLKPASLLWGKLAGNYFLIMVILLPAFLLMLISLISNPSADLLYLRLLAMLASYAIYFFIITAWVICISSLSSSSGASLLLNLGVWAFFCVFLPRLTAGFIDRSYPLPVRSEFNRLVDQGYSKGINGDQGNRERRADYEKKILAQYKVDSVQNLPLNFDGLAMQYGEDYLSRVYKKYAQEIEETIRKQQKLQEAFSFINPFMAVQQLSMAYAGTDYLHHVDFHRNAQKYRDAFIRILNLNMAYGGSEYLTYDYKVGPEFFKKMKNFEYSLPAVKVLFKQHVAALSALALWFCALLFMIPVVSKKLIKT